MLGAIAGDIIGSVHEFFGGKTKDFPLFVPESRFTDDTVLTIAVADCLITSFLSHQKPSVYPSCGSYGATNPSAGEARQNADLPAMGRRTGQP